MTFKSLAIFDGRNDCDNPVVTSENKGAIVKPVSMIADIIPIVDKCGIDRLVTNETIPFPRMFFSVKDCYFYRWRQATLTLLKPMLGLQSLRHGL